MCSKQYTAQAFWEFINENINAFKDATAYVPDEDDCMDLCQNDVWCEHY